MKSRRIVAVFVCILMLAGMFPTAAAAMDVMAAEAFAEPDSLRLEPSETNGIPAQIDLFKRTTTSGPAWNPQTVTTYELYLPGDAAVEDCFFSWDGGLAATVDGETYDSGACPVPAPDTTRTYTFTLDGHSTEFRVTTYQGSQNVPAVFIVIDESLGTIEAMDGDTEHNAECSGTIFIDGEEYGLTKMKGRGNATWAESRDKRPYNITLDTKINFPGVNSEKSKKWTLLAEVLDHSLLRNRSGFYLAEELGIGQPTTSADVWMNGEYQGCYTVTPKTDSFVTKDGFLIEQDNYQEKPIEQGGDPQFDLTGLISTVSGWSSAYNLITVKKMGDNLLLKDGVVDESAANMKAAADRIEAWLQDAWDAIRSDNGYNSSGKYYTEYIDIESFAKMYLMHEYVKSYDVCAGSILFHRDGQTDADKLIAGPLWDLDNAMGSVYRNSSLGRADDRRNGDRRSAEGAFIPNITEYKTSIYKTISKHPDFMEEVGRQYNKYKAAFDNLEADVSGMISDIEASARMNHYKVIDLGNGSGKNLHYYGSATTLGSGQYQQRYLATTDAKTDWGNYTENLKTYIRTRTLWFANNYYDPDYVDPANCSHAWEETASVPATCTSAGSITYTCPICKDSYTETIPKLAHDYQNGECTFCHEILIDVAISCDAGASVTVYETQDPDGAYFENATLAHPRDGDTGLIDCSGAGQVNFVVELKPGYDLVSVAVEPSTAYKNLKETDVENGYRITKITGDLTISVTTVPQEPVIRSCSIVLSGQIGVNFFMTIPETITDGIMTFSVGERSVTADGTLLDDGRVKFTCYVNSVEMAERIYAEYSYTVNGEAGTVTTDTSVQEYLEVIINNTGDLEAYTKATPLAKAIYNYGYFAMLAVPGGNDHPMMPDTYAGEAGLIAELDGYPITASLDKTVITGASYSLTLDYETAINFYLTTDSELTKEDVLVSATDGATFDYTVVKKGDSRYQVQITNIGAHELGCVFTVTIGDSTISASALSYVQQCLSRPDDEQKTKDAAAALYAYYRESIEYLK